MSLSDSAGAAAHVTLLIHSMAADGGAQRRIVDLANAFDRLGRQVDLVVLDGAGALGQRLAPGVKRVDLATGKGSRRDRLLAALRSDPPDVLMSGATTVHSLALAAGAASGGRLPVVLRASRHPVRPLPWSLPLSRAVEPINERLWMRRYARADAVVAVSEEVAEGLRARLSGTEPEVVTILNPVVMGAAAAMPEARDPGSVPLILGVGRLRPQKDFATLIRAVAQVRAVRPVHLKIFGEGEQRGRLLGLARRLSVADIVELPGRTDAIAEWLRRADVLVSSSLWEGLPGVVIEALAAGCPVVATTCPGGSREILEDGRLGRLVPMRDPGAMAAAILATLAAPPEPARLIAGASRFGEAGKAQQYVELFDRLVMTRRRRVDGAVAAPKFPARP